MPFVLLFVGLMLTIVAVRDNQDAFYAQLTKDFTGQNNFTEWAIALVAFGSVGYYRPARTPIDLFLALMLITFAYGAFKSNNTTIAGFIEGLQSAFAGATNSAQAGSSTATSPPSGQAAINATQQAITNDGGMTVDQYLSQDNPLAGILNGSN